ncbi:pyridoxal phosphate-dependent aminotransferase [Sphingosinicella ginsenosidimutans]|uniref:Aminotransferase class I/II-fold pyridoxal phosphate-dependent enzyme n=1 Tax=Allosphingosinicella ginsenosidimutans TaxID=1176539 RepID=A0A5C6TW61_9SPHN|nr:pyridoxal phosphate-dependent aminotransferase [Sphingosinicella ginsenosidimutans]TXC64105.1 aminotransferase class I/II-fold pyridoxal phosphate-dependent enzyme [Sphingosinicella ginsenosidimutans]
MSGRVLQSDYMHWAKTRAPVTYNLASSEVPHFRLDRFAIEIADLELDGASRHRDPPLRAAIARKAGVDAAQVVMADGTSMANMLAMAALVGPGDEVLAETPAYEPMIATARFLGAGISSVARRAPDFRIDPEAIAAAMTPRTKLILLTNLHNPTGVLASEAELRAIGEIAAKAGAYVLVDEVYLDAAATPQRSCVHLGSQFIATASLTKVYGLSGLRCGWILAAPELAEKIWRLNELFGVSQAHADERLSTIALDRLGEVAADTPALLAHNRALVNDFLAGRDDLEAPPVVGGVTCFPRLVRGNVDALDGLLRARYDAAIVPGRFFGLADHFRLGFGQPTGIVAGGLERLGAALDSLR